MTIDEARLLYAVVITGSLLRSAKRVATLPPFWSRERGIWVPPVPNLSRTRPTSPGRAR